MMADEGKENYPVVFYVNKEQYLVHQTIIIGGSRNQVLFSLIEDSSSDFIHCYDIVLV